MVKTRRPAHSSKSITLDDLAQNFHLPINDVAQKLGLCVTVLKQRCRENGITRWPYRKVRKLDNLINALEPTPEIVPSVVVPVKTDPVVEDVRRLEAARETRQFLLANPNSTVHLTVGRVKTPRRKAGDSDQQSLEKSSGGVPGSENQQQVADTASSRLLHSSQQRESINDQVDEVPPTLPGCRTTASRPSCPLNEPPACPHPSPHVLPGSQEDLRSYKVMERSNSFLSGGSGSAFRPMDKSAFRPMERSCSLTSLLNGMDGGGEPPTYLIPPAQHPSQSPSPQPTVPTPSPLLPHPISHSPGPLSIPTTPSPPPGYGAANLAYLQAWVQQHAAMSAHQAATAAVQQAARQVATAQHPAAQGYADMSQGALNMRYPSSYSSSSGMMLPSGGHGHHVSGGAWPVPGMLELAHMAAWSASSASWNANLNKMMSSGSHGELSNVQMDSRWQMQGQGTPTLA